MTIVVRISPMPVTKPGISIFSILPLGIIPFRYDRSFVALSCQVATTILYLEQVSHIRKYGILQLILPQYSILSKLERKILEGTMED